MLCTALHCTIWHCHSMLCTALQCSAILLYAMYRTALYHLALPMYCTAVQWSTTLCYVLHCTVPFGTAIPCYVLHCSAVLYYYMFCYALKCTALLHNSMFCYALHYSGLRYSESSVWFFEILPEFNLDAVLSFLSNLRIMQSLYGLRYSKRHFIFWTYRSFVCGKTQSEIAMASCAAAYTGDARCATYPYHSSAPFLHPAALTACHAATCMKINLAYMRGGMVESLTVYYLFLHVSFSFQ